MKKIIAALFIFVLSFLMAAAAFAAVPVVNEGRESVSISGLSEDDMVIIGIYDENRLLKGVKHYADEISYADIKAEYEGADLMKLFIWSKTQSPLSSPYEIELNKTGDGLVTLTKSGANIQFRSDWSDTEDMAIRCTMNGSQNKSFNLTNYTLMNAAADKTDIKSGTLFKTASDDIAPAYFNDSYIGANHGWYKAYTITTTAEHGITSANIGQTWTDSNGNELLILSVPSKTTVMVCVPSTNANRSYLATATISGTITNGNISAEVSSAVKSQLRPAANHASVAVYKDGDKEITEDGVYDGSFFDVVESYDIIYVPAMFSYLRENVGSNTNGSYYSEDIAEKYCTVRVRYRFTERGAMTVYESFELAKPVRWEHAHFVQSIGIGSYLSVPNSIYDRLTALSSSNIMINNASWSDLNDPPSRFYQYADENMSKGMCLGFDTRSGDARPELQKTMKMTGYYNGKTRKMYPEISYKTVTKSAGTSVEAVCYRVPLGTYDADIPSVGWYYTDDDIYLLLDVQKSVDKHLKLPEHMNGRKIEVVEAFGDILIPDTAVSSDGIRISVDTYGSAILKLSK